MHSRIGIGSEWLRKVLHDLAQPLNRIRITAQDVRIDVRESRVDLGSLAESMLEIEREIDRLASRFDLLRRMVAPPESSVPSVASVGVDLRAVLEATAEQARKSFPGASISEELIGGLWVDMAAAWALEHALWELVCNGIEAARDCERAPQLTLRSQRRGQQAVLAVEDNGAGIREDARSNVFAPFFTTRPGAAGMGLALARSIAAELGGALEITRSDESGTVFELVISAGDAAPSSGDADEDPTRGR